MAVLSVSLSKNIDKRMEKEYTLIDKVFFDLTVMSTDQEEKKEAIAADAEASALFKEFTDFQEDFYAKMQAGTMPTAEEQAAVQELGQKVEANALLKEYLAAQQGLSVYLNDIERIIFKPLQELNS